MNPRPKEWREEYLHVERSSTQLRKDLVVAFDRIHGLEHKLSRAVTKIWILTGLVGIAGSVISWLATQLLARLH